MNTTHTTPALVTQDLTKRYGSRAAVDNLSIEVPAGVVAGFIGPNGAGKTTTMAMLFGLVAPTSGSASVLGSSVDNPASYLGRVGALIETPAFWPGLTGIENLRVLATLSGRDPQRIPEVLDLVGLGGRGGDRFGEYSLGMKQRLGIAAALLGDPELLVLDEPTNGLDPAGMAEMRAFIAALGDRGVTVLLSSHLMPEVEQVSDRVGVIRDGVLVAEGTVDELRGRARLRVLAHPAGEAARIVAALPGVAGVDRDGDALDIAADGAQAAAINAALVGAGIAVSELVPRRASLEDVFLQLTGGGAAA
jgi:ABC-2 type transport system ATP-binding protein